MYWFRSVYLTFALTLSTANLASCYGDLLDTKDVSRNLIPVSRLKDTAKQVNSMDTTWEAELLESWVKKDATLLDLSHLTGTLDSNLVDKSEFKMRKSNVDDDNNSDEENRQSDDSSQSEDERRALQCVDNGLPKSFDARDKWPKCKSTISHIYDQGRCGSCWATSEVAAFTDRVCIQSNGKHTELRSVQQVLSCCHKGVSKDGCNGGSQVAAFDYIRRNGLSTGGDYDSEKGCQPYRIKPCAHHINGTKLKLCSSYPRETAHKCKLHCYNKNYKTPFKKDRIKVKNIYFLDPCAIMNEIHQRGPVVTSFNVYEDFYLYKKGVHGTGVYQYTTGNLMGRHAVRIIGWGEEKGTPYWLATNSWNESWGEKGYFKIIRDSPGNCFFQEEAAACTVDV